MCEMSNVLGLKQYHSINYEKLRGNKAGLSSVRVNDLYCIEFKEEIAFRGISQRQLADKIGLSYSVLNEILNARRNITEKTALLFEASLVINADPLMRLQLKFNMRTAKNDKSFMQRLEKIRRIAATL